MECWVEILAFLQKRSGDSNNEVLMVQFAFPPKAANAYANWIANHARIAMALRSSGRKLSFEILSESSSVEEGQFLLYQSNTGPIEKVSASPEKPNRKKKKHRKKKPAESYSVVPEDPITESRFIDSNSAIQNGNVFLENRSSSVVGGGSVVYTVIDVAEVAECQSVLSISGSELRQRNVSNGGGGEEEMVSSSRVEENWDSG
ncbi:hypothetical protein GH714_007472 [Hevea brasiliensis]|uniref:Uncharacterized protein n=1 Tax=Hevea brasiliensis TaxID=3981 RepID=A0A6A6LYQ3_HEVBR|nr:hypothetical protein GH714_007472 [Hevea brasiliensis]